ncbi:MAG: hypothetical protein GY835_04440 [bacterium]|nr:hypothetical protein [bacterium]
MHNPIQKVSLLYYEGLASFTSWRNWLPLLMFWAIQAICLTFLTHFSDLPGGDWLISSFKGAFGLDALEYPGFYLLLPDLHQRLYMALAGTLGIFMQGVSLLYLMQWHTRGQVTRERIWIRVLRRWPGLFVINLISLALFLGPLIAVKHLLLPVIESASAGRGLFLACYGIGFVAEILLAYAAFLLLAFDSGLKASLVASVKFAAQNIWVMICLIMIPFFLALPLQWVAAARVSIITRFRPELIFYLLLLNSLVMVAILFIQLSTLVRYYAEEKLRKPFAGEWDDKDLPERRVYDPGSPGR